MTTTTAPRMPSLASRVEMIRGMSTHLYRNYFTMSEEGILESLRQIREELETAQRLVAKEDL